MPSAHTLAIGFIGLNSNLVWWKPTIESSSFLPLDCTSSTFFRYLFYDFLPAQLYCYLVQFLGHEPASLYEMRRQIHNAAVAASRDLDEITYACNVAVLVREGVSTRRVKWISFDRLHWSKKRWNTDEFHLQTGF